MESLLEADHPLINTGVLSQSPAQFSQLWAIREGITEAVSKEGKAYKYDISIPLGRFKDVVDATREQLRSKGLLRDDAVKHVVGYGHVGDGEFQQFISTMSILNTLCAGNLHLNIVAAAYTPEIEAALEPFVYELVGEYLVSRDLLPRLNCFLSTTASFNGSISAEHGIGVMKTHALHYSKNATSIELMKKIKELFDPKGIMNPGKVLP